MTRLSKQDIGVLAQLVQEEIVAYKKGQIERLTTNGELAYMLNISRCSVINYLVAINEGERRYRSSKLKSQAAKELNNKPEFLKAHKERSKERLKQLHKDPEFAEANRERNRKRMTVLNADPEFAEANRERMRKRHKNPDYRTTMNEIWIATMERLNKDPNFMALYKEGIKRRNANPDFIKIVRESGIKLSESHRKNAYHIESRFYASSQQEGATALLLEKYIMNYQVEEGETIQVRDKEINNGGIDFLVNGEFLEWHPAILYHGRRGDITSKEEANSYRKVLESLSEEEKKAFQKDYEQVLAVNYRNSRQEAIDNSGYAGANVALATNVKELYDFMSRHSANLPSYKDFKGEFKAAVKKVKSYAVKKDKAVEEAA